MKKHLKRFVRSIINPMGYDLVPVALVKPPSKCEAARLVLAWIFESGNASNTVLLQIGACDGVGADPVHKFVRQGLMRAYLVEPLPGTFRSLAKTYAHVDGVTCINCAVGSEDGEAIMYTVKGAANYGASSLSKNHVSKHIGSHTEHEIEEIKVKVRSYKTLLLENAIDHVDFVQIDVEGMDDLIVLSILESDSDLPKFINFESVHLPRKRSNELFRRLARNYVWIHDEYNTLAIRNDIYEEMT